MQLKNIEHLLAWAFQMHDTVIVQGFSYRERVSANYSDLNMGDRHNLATDVLAKVARLDQEDMVCIVAKHTLAAKAVHDAAYLLPNWPRPMQLALVRRWGGDTRQSQREIAEMCGYSRKTINQREAEAASILNKHYWHGCDILEVQLSDLLRERLISA